jgi:hypothetical protein
MAESGPADGPAAAFCCCGCRQVYELLVEAGLTEDFRSSEGNADDTETL